MPKPVKVLFTVILALAICCTVMLGTTQKVKAETLDTVVCSVIGPTFSMTAPNPLQIAPYSGTACDPYPNDTSFYYAWTSLSAPIVATWKGPTSVGGRAFYGCRIQVNIPPYWAGAHYANYTVETSGGTVLYQTTIDQYWTSGWQIIDGNYTFPTDFGHPGFVVVMTDQEAPGQPAAADAVDFSCDALS